MQSLFLVFGGWGWESSEERVEGEGGIESKKKSAFLRFLFQRNYTHYN